MEEIKKNLLSIPREYFISAFLFFYCFILVPMGVAEQNTFSFIDVNHLFCPLLHADDSSMCD